MNEILKLVYFFFLNTQKEYVAARKEYEAALKLDPSNQLLLDNLKKLERIEKSSKS